MNILKELSNDKIIEFNKINIEKYLSKKHINIENIEDIFKKIEIEIGEKKNFLMRVLIKIIHTKLL